MVLSVLIEILFSRLGLGSTQFSYQFFEFSSNDSPFCATRYSRSNSRYTVRSFFRLPYSNFPWQTFLRSNGFSIFPLYFYCSSSYLPFLLSDMSVLLFHRNETKERNVRKICEQLNWIAIHLVVWQS